MPDDTSYKAVSVSEAMMFASYGVYHECDGDVMEANVVDYDLGREPCANV